ncbi:glycosyltransferase [Maribellus comscasis]|uniref:Glycosyltransferase n=1 Tax=Maribellus comscasis TaxID=2681766 RepID=A0A6I6JP24_9BACT|nr:glycosyltransferase [Maribellus comscasis]QGY42740.1 glycosyltransferase [Maribellus comscasis]
MIKGKSNIPNLIDSPLVSICCFTFNHSKFIHQAIDGFLLQQTNFHFEIIIHDDASTDGTTEILKSYQKKYPELIRLIIQNTNQWSNGERMLLATFVLPKVRGKYIAFCEGDDYWIDPEKLQKQVNFLEKKHEYSMCFHDALIFKKNDKNVNEPFGKITNREYTGKEILAKWIIPTASIVFRRDLYFPIYNPNFLHGDIVLCLTLAQRGKVYGMSEIMSVYRKQKGGMSSNYQGIDFFRLFLKHRIEIHNTFREFTGYQSKRFISLIIAEIAWGKLKNYSISFVYYIVLAIRWSPIGFLHNLYNVISTGILSMAKREK